MVLEETDQELIEACQRGEAEAFRGLFERHKDKIFSVALRYSGDAAVAQEIPQETFLKIFTGLKSFRGNSDFGSWLYRVVVNSCLDEKRKSRRLMPLLDEALAILPARDLSAFDEVARTELRGHLHSVVAGLPDEQRILLVLRYTQNLSYDEIAGILGTSHGTIASRLSRIHKTLERRLSRFARGKDGKRGRFF
jgi:RNA polymerase sigma-70 factor (ECF subfamily)